MDEFEQNDEKETSDSHNPYYQNAILYAFASLKECPPFQQHVFRSVDCNIDKRLFI